MAIPLKPTDIADLSTLTYNTMVKDKTWNDISNTLQTHTVTSRFFKGQKKNVESGPKMIWKLQVTNTEACTYTGLFDEDRYDIRDLAIGAEQDWAMWTTNMTWDLREPAFQSDNRAKLVDALLMRRNAMYNDYFNFVEREFWSAPTAPPAAPGEVFKLCGIPFWVQKSASLGFNGGNPSGFTSGAGGVSSSTYPTWANYTGTFSSAGAIDDLVAKVDTAVTLCDFVAPHEYSQTDDGPPQHVMYTTLPNITKMKKYLKSRQDNISNMGLVSKVQWDSMPVERVAALDTPSFATYDSTNPFYGIDWGSIKWYFLEGKDMDRTDPFRRSDAHNIWVEPYDSIAQIICTNRRKQFVFYQV